jgi:RNA polymerase sigma-70 factor (ECF subfamily)
VGIWSRSFCVIEALYGQSTPFLIGEHRPVREDEFERLFDEHAQALFGFLVYRTGDRVLAEDLVADTFERALRARRRFDPRKAKAKTWLYTIALNRLRDVQRSAAAERRALERVGGPDEAEAGQDAVEHRDEVMRAMAVLSGEERDAVALRFGAELTVPEMAKLLGEPLTRVEGRVYRALRKLRGELAPPR